MYLIDASVLITAKNQYFEIDRVPEFWDWLTFQGQLGNVKIPHEIYEEFRAPKKEDGTQDALASWASDPIVKTALLLPSEVSIEHLQLVITNGYNLQHPTDEDVETMGKDPFLISYALSLPDNCCVVTAEWSKPSINFAKSKMPDVCNRLNVRSCDLFTLLRELNFTTNFRERSGVKMDI